jgi:regulator of sigma E protease
MEFIGTALHVIASIFVVACIFSLIIFVHELGHFLAAKWRGLAIDRFQIWFGKPIWKKTIGGVQYGLGWIPAGGFVALPQMAPMESIEGSNGERTKPLPPIKPLDKIIVAFAGPLFSFLFALAVAAVVWKVGKPADLVRTTTIGYVKPDSPAARGGLLPGDRILAINGDPVEGFAGSLDGVMETIMLSEGKKISFDVERPDAGKLTIPTGFEADTSKWYQRRELPHVGVSWEQPTVIARIVPGSPAELDGLKVGDRIVSINGTPLHSPLQLGSLLKASQGEVQLAIRRAGALLTLTATPQVPEAPAGRGPSLGFEWDPEQGIDKTRVYPGPWRQVTDSLRMMSVTLEKLFAPDSSVGIDHLSGPVGIAKTKYKLLQMEDGWRRVLWFMVLFNVNLAILNMLPLPVLDGGHITLAILEKIARRPVKARFLEALQAVFAILLICVMLFVTSKDIGDDIGRGGDSSATEMRFAPR